MNASHFDPASASAWNLGSQAWEFKQANIGTATANQIFFSPGLGRVDVNVLVCDTVFDGQERYDTAFFDFDRDLANGFVAQRAGDWGAFRPAPNRSSRYGLSRSRSGLVGAWVKLLAFEPNLSAFNVYLGNVTHNVGYPQSFINDIEKSIGFWPAEADFFNLERALIDEATYMEQLERLADYLNDAMLLATKNYDFDLLMGYQVQTDEAGHEFTLSTRAS